MNNDFEVWGKAKEGKARRIGRVEEEGEEVVEWWRYWCLWVKKRERVRPDRWDELMEEQLRPVVNGGLGALGLW